MNKKKYKNLIYKTRPLTDLKDMVRQSVELYGPKDAYLTKDVPGGEYRGISFDDFGQDIDAMGTALLARGLKDARIAVVGENSYKWVVSYLSVTNGTGVVVPLDKELPTNEMEGLIERAEVRAIFTSAKLEKKLAEMGKKTLKGVDYIIRMTSSDAEHIKGPKTLNFDDLIAEGRKLMAEGNRSFIDAKIEPHKMCSLLFTSGTTGTAKGVMLSHRNIVQNVVNMSKYVDIGIDGIGLSVLPMHHTFEMTCHIMTSIYQGLTVCICEGLKYIMKNMAEAKCTHMLAVPLIFEQMHKKIMKQAE
ncbi:MAG: AMP-binding protein, partial [Firmicutes bacterium]|nr:AMP-binding protein [Bacillota bacterium]